MSRATSGRLRLNDEILSGKAMFTKLHYTFLGKHYDSIESVYSSISQKHLLIEVISCPPCIYDGSLNQRCCFFNGLSPFVLQESFGLAKRIYLSILLYISTRKNKTDLCLEINTNRH